MAVDGEEPLYRIPGWALLDRQFREIWGCSLATLLGAGNLGLALATAPPVVTMPGAEFPVLSLAYHGAAAVLLLVYGAIY